MAEPPVELQILVGVALATIVGCGLTDTLTIAELVQLPFEPKTVYVVFTLGETTTLAPVKLPGFQV